MLCTLFAMLSDNPAAAGGGIVGGLISLVTIIAAITRWLEARRRAKEVTKIPPIEVAPQVPAPAPLLPQPPNLAELRLRHLEELSAQQATMQRRIWELEHELKRKEERIAELEGALIRERAETARARSRGDRLERRVEQLQRVVDEMQRAVDDASARRTAAEERLSELDGGGPETRPTAPQGRRRGNT